MLFTILSRDSEPQRVVSMQMYNLLEEYILQDNRYQQ